MNFTLITGASQGIGRALAEAFAEEGHHLILTSRDKDKLTSLQKMLVESYGVNVHIYSIDLLENQAVENLYEWCIVNKLHVNVLVNNAGIGLYGNFEEIALESYMDMVHLNQNVVLSMCYTFLPMLQELPKAYILNVSSVAAYQPTPFLSVYAATKSFILMFSRALRQELIKTNVHVCCLCPGPTATNFYETAGFEEKTNDLKNMQMTPQNVAKVAIDGMLRNQAVIVPGFSNKIGTFFTRLIPSAMLTELISFVLKPKKGKKR